jgi:hypothetical protein
VLRQDEAGRKILQAVLDLEVAILMLGTIPPHSVQMLPNPSMQESDSELRPRRKSDLIDEKAMEAGC